MDKMFVITVAVLTLLTIAADAKPVYQYLEAREGHIPVYIRFGDQSLSEINPSLAEAFGEHEVSARNIKAENEPASSNFGIGSLVPSSKTIEEATKLFPIPSIPFFADKGAGSKSEQSDKENDSKSSQETTTKKA